ncbi:calcium/proton exchanger [Nocardioides marmorisolisilvae]|uniref:Ca(2+)/H(+) antiporter n=1 Tax=Nocardioides marmorisolisilvae TaxID=1542737 RepID=A0A3N0DUV9_9ACTN|nr:calcium/proton exchanger [Nocardioides marmorisolisilvae]RNL79415.1 calcium/proton exchanger [Nocardioides marmorisolisilvae]
MSVEQTSGQTFIRSDLVVIGGGAGLCVLAGIAHYGNWNSVVSFLVSAAAVCLLASLVGRSVEQLGDRFGPGATGVLQSALGNLPELFICIFALKSGLVDVVRAALIGSILANLLLVLGLAFLVGGLKHGTQKLGSERARTISVLMLLSVTAMAIPSIAHEVHSPAGSHEVAFSVIVSIILLALFALSLPFSLRRDPDSTEVVETEPPRWPVWLAITMLAVAGALAAFVSDWFVKALEPAMDTLNISPVFAGLVIVAIAGNAVENVVGVQLAARGQSEYAFSVILNSPIQIALVLAPALVLISQIFGLASLTLVFGPMLVVSLMLSVILAAAIAQDGESTWLEGATLIALYGIIATSFWWG